ncbi:MAG: hypothetical protein ACLTDF_01930 [Coprococcus sp.]
MDERVKIVFGLLGGLAMFLYGMNSMSDALQKAAGEDEEDIGIPYQESFDGSFGGSTCNRSSPE